LIEKSEGKKGTPQSFAFLAFLFKGTIGRGMGLDAASAENGKGTPKSTVLFVGVL
jgi:hypothetical protein